MEERKDFGVLYGQRTTEEYLLIYSSYEDSKASPTTGDFIVLTQRDEGGIKYLARIEAEIYDEDPIFRQQDKTLVAVHYARIAERELSERDKQKIFSYTYKVNILGTFSTDGKDFTTAVRRLPTVSYLARRVNTVEFDNILNGANTSAEDAIPIAIGKLCIGTEIQRKKQDILFDIEKLREKRTMIFAQSGFGKTNIMKVLLYHMMGDTGYGKLIFDLNGEYCFKSKKTYGLADINEQKIKDNLVLFTDKKFDNKYEGRFILGGKVLLNMHVHLTIGDILNFSTGFSEVMKSFLLYLDDSQVNDFIVNINNYVNDPSQLHKNYPDFWDGKKEASARNTIAAIRKRVAYLIDENKGLHSSSSTAAEDIFEYLKQGKTVIIDLSLKDSVESNILSTIIVRKLFEHNKAFFTEQQEDKVIDTVICVEEAQNVLSEEFVRSNANPFVRVAKEGRKFRLGLIAITQRPSAISEEIRTQAENFFSFFMGNSDDIRALVKSNISFDGVIAKFLQTETIPGNLYMVSAKQSFALPIRVLEFEAMVESKVYDDSKL